MAKRKEDQNEAADSADRVADNPAESVAALVAEENRSIANRLEDRPEADVPEDIVGTPTADALLGADGDFTHSQVAAINRARLARGEKPIVPEGLDDERTEGKSLMEVEADEAGLKPGAESGAGGDLSEAPLDQREDQRDEARHE